MPLFTFDDLAAALPTGAFDAQTVTNALAAKGFAPEPDEVAECLFLLAEDGTVTFNEETGLFSAA